MTKAEKTKDMKELLEKLAGYCSENYLGRMTAKEIADVGWAHAIIEQQAREIAALKEIQQDVIDGAMADLGDQVEQQAREIERQRRHRKWALKLARKWLAGCRLLDYSDTERAPAGAVKTWMKQWAAENDRAVAAERRLVECQERVKELEAEYQSLLACRRRGENESGYMERGC